MLPQRNSPSTSIVELASSRVQKQLTSAAKSNNRTPGKTSQRNTPSASIVEVASSRVLETFHCQICPKCASADKYTFCLYTCTVLEVASSRVQKHLPWPNLAIEFQIRPHRATHHHCYSRGYKFQVQKHLLTP